MSCCLKTVVKCVVVVCLVAVVLLATTEMVKGALQRKTPPRLKKVNELFNKNCARCHGADGRGDTPSGKLFQAPDFTDAEWWNKNSRITNTKNLRLVVTRGKATMPAFGKKLTRTEINLLVERIRSFRKSERKS